MKKILTILLALCVMMAFVACGANNTDNTTAASTAESTEGTVAPSFGLEETLPSDATTAAAEVEVMTYAEYDAAEKDSKVVVECYVQATQSWWEDTITVYAQDQDGAYFLYELACSEEDAAKLVAGTKIRVTGYKGEWAGEIEIVDGTFEFVENADAYVAEAKDLTEKLGAEDIIDYQNQLVAFKGMTVKEISYKNDEPGDDIYVTLSYGEADYSFCVEVYLTGTDSDVYKTVGELKAGDVVDVECFLYWYEGMNPHITSITVK